MKNLLKQQNGNVDRGLKGQKKRTHQRLQTLPRTYRELICVQLMHNSILVGSAMLRILVVRSTFSKDEAFQASM